MASQGFAPLTIPKSLSARLLVLTVVFVMVSEVLIFVPSIARFRLVYLEDRIVESHLATLALEASPDHMISPALEQKLLDHARVKAVALMRPEMKTLALGFDMPPTVDASFDLRAATPVTLIRDAFDTLLQRDGRIIRVLGPPPQDPSMVVDAIFDEAPMRADMYDYAGRILNLSIAISLITAGLVYLSLQWLMVRPMRRITESMVAFRKAPEDTAPAIVPSERNDEIGIAQRELADMQAELRTALKQKTRLAALGTAVSKINHDLRNILATAQLISDRLSSSDDPEVRRVTPMLVRTIDRAIELCTNTLRFGKAEEQKPVRTRFPLHELVDDVMVALGSVSGSGISWRNDVADDLTIDADRDQIHRVLLNLGRNAMEAMAGGGTGEIVVRAGHRDSMTTIDFSDTGPGLPEEVRENLFEAYTDSARGGGTGLGLAIARDLMRGHGGDISLVETGSSRTTFRLELPES